jgi:hypothetical protein
MTICATEFALDEGRLAAVSLTALHRIHRKTTKNPDWPIGYTHSPNRVLCLMFSVISVQCSKCRGRTNVSALPGSA